MARCGRRTGDLGLERSLAPLELVQLRLQTRRSQAIGNGFDEAVELAPDVIELTPLQDRGQLSVAPLPVHIRATRIGGISSRRFIEMIGDGRSNKEIARALEITPETAKSHVKNIFVKLAVEKRDKAVARAESLGLVRTH